MNCSDILNNFNSTFVGVALLTDLQKSLKVIFLYILMVERLREFSLPSSMDLEKIGSENRINIFRKYFANIRFNRLLIQLTLIRSIFDQNAIVKLSDLEDHQRNEFFGLIKRIKELHYYEEFVFAAKEEEKALERIIEAYCKRMNINE